MRSYSGAGPCALRPVGFSTTGAASSAAHVAPSTTALAGFILRKRLNAITAFAVAPPKSPSTIRPRRRIALRCQLSLSWSSSTSPPPVGSVIRVGSSGAFRCGL